MWKESSISALSCITGISNIKNNIKKLELLKIGIAYTLLMCYKAIRIFLNASIENAGLPFAVQHKKISYSLEEAVYDSKFQRNIHGPFENAEDAVASILED